MRFTQTVVRDYLAQSVMEFLREFGSIKGWPSLISSDPGSQLVSAAGSMESWWRKMENDLLTLAGRQGFKWITNPANSPWRQGETERRIGMIK